MLDKQYLRLRRCRYRRHPTSSQCQSQFSNNANENMTSDDISNRHYHSSLIGENDIRMDPVKCERTSEVHSFNIVHRRPNQDTKNTETYPVDVQSQSNLGEISRPFRNESETRPSSTRSESISYCER